MTIRLKNIPLLIKSFVFTYIGVYGVSSMYYGIEQTNPFIDMIRLVLITFFSIFFAYGVICFIRDVKKGGIHRVLQKIGEFFNNDSF